MSEIKGTAKSPLSRWSERKLAARRGEALDEPVADVQAAEPPPPVEAASLADVPAEESEVSALPSIDDLDFQSDYTQFLTQKVPEALRRAALRKLWASDPVLANLDGLNDYDEDFNVVDQVITLAQSSYRPGLGYLDEAEKKFAQIDEALGGNTPDLPSAPAQIAPNAEDGALRDNRDDNAVPSVSADAPQQSADAAIEQGALEPAKDSDKSPV